MFKLVITLITYIVISSQDFCSDSNNFAEQILTNLESFGEVPEIHDCATLIEILNNIYTNTSACNVTVSSVWKDLEERGVINSSTEKPSDFETFGDGCPETCKQPC